MFQNGGLRCPMQASGCKALVRLDGIKRLMAVSARVLPDPRSSSDTPPLTIEESNKFERFLFEASIPATQRCYCISRACVDDKGFRTLNDLGEELAPQPGAPPRKFDCKKCSIAICNTCKRAWHPYTTDCEKANKEKRGLSEALINVTTKPCPKCGFRVSHWHGHSCHHISPETRGCPQCHTHWCYSCGTAGARSPGYCDTSPRCRLYCEKSNITEFLENSSGWPTDRRCGCAICPDCRPNRPCSKCPGSCVVCRGLVPHGEFTPNTD